MFWESPPIPLCKYIIWTYLINLISEKKCLTSMYINWKCFFQNSPIRLCNYVCQLNQSTFRKLKSTAKIIENVSSKTHPSVYPPCKPSASPPRKRFGFFAIQITHIYLATISILIFFACASTNTFRLFSSLKKKNKIEMNKLFKTNCNLRTFIIGDNFHLVACDVVGKADGAFIAKYNIYWLTSLSFIAELYSRAIPISHRLSSERWRNEVGVQIVELILFPLVPLRYTLQ